MSRRMPTSDFWLLRRIHSSVVGAEFSRAVERDAPADLVASAARGQAWRGNRFRPKSVPPRARAMSTVAYSGQGRSLLDSLNSGVSRCLAHRAE